MDNTDYSKAENAVNNAQNAVNNAANTTKWKSEEYADRAKDYIREHRENNTQPTHEGWLERAKHSVAEAWDDTKDAVSDAWEKTKDWAEDATGEVKKAGIDAKTEYNKATN